jgi:uncharacterized protein (DUF1697 family)
MTYVALLRGINVGGNNKVEMKRLKNTFERLGFQEVRTYINSGNIIFDDSLHSQAQLITIIEEAIKNDFNLSIKVLIRDAANLRVVEAALPKAWVNSADQKCDVMFLWADVDSLDILHLLPIKPLIEDLVYVPGALIWRIDRKNFSESSLSKLVGSPLYKSMTIRNCNTLRKLVLLLEKGV